MNPCLHIPRSSARVVSFLLNLHAHANHHEELEISGLLCCVLVSETPVDCISTVASRYSEIKSLTKVLHVSGVLH